MRGGNGSSITSGEKLCAGGGGGGGSALYLNSVSVENVRLIAGGGGGGAVGISLDGIVAADGRGTYVSSPKNGYSRGIALDGFDGSPMSTRGDWITREGEWCTPSGGGGSGGPVFVCYCGSHSGASAGSYTSGAGGGRKAVAFGKNGYEIDGSQTKPTTDKDGCFRFTVLDSLTDAYPVVNVE